MYILAFESSAKPASVAVLEVENTRKLVDSFGQQGFDSHSGGKPLINRFGQHKLLGLYTQNNGFSHSRTILAMAESALKNLDLKPIDIELVAVAKGPGSFTGVRIGVSAAKGFAWGLDLPICGVSTLEAMARQTQIENTIICSVMDARREQVYNGLFEWKDNKLHRLCEDRAISIEELSIDLSARNKPFMFVGDGIDVCQSNVSLKKHIKTPDLLRLQSAYGVALGALHTEPIKSELLEPFYLRPPQAERERSSSAT